MSIAFAKSAKCGVKAPNCVFLSSGSPDASSLVPLSSALICERAQKLLITGDRTACCQPKDATTVAPEENGDFISQINRFTDIINKMIEDKDTISEDDVAANLQKIYDEFTAAAIAAGYSIF